MDTGRSVETPPHTPKDKFTEVQRLLLEKRLRGDFARKGEDAVTPRDPLARVPLSAEQKRIWLHASQESALAIYNEPITIYRYGAFSLQVLEASLNEVVHRHEAWRTSFNASGECVVSESFQVRLPLTDLSSLPAPLREAEALRIATEDAEKPFCLDALPLFRARVVKMSPDEHRLYITLHHIIFDGVSLSRVLLPELSAIYAAFEQGKPSPLSPPPLQYGDYAIWRESQLQSPEIKRHLAYWVKQLSGELPVLRLPVDRPRRPFPSHHGSMERFEVPYDLVQKLKLLSHACGVTLYTTLLTAFQVLLFRYSGQEDLIVGTATDARRRSELQLVMGYFLDTLAIRTRPVATASFVDYLAQTQDALLEAFQVADVPFDRIVHEINPKRESSHHPVFQAFFSMRPASATMPAGWKLAHLDVTVDASKFDIYLELGELTDRIEGRILYNTDIFDPVSIKGITQHLLTLLGSICEQPNTTIGVIPFLTPEESAVLIGESGWNNTSREFPQATLQSLIEVQARKTPDAIAARCGSLSFTYEQLVIRSDEIAVLLRGSGVVRGSVVAIALERSLDLLAGMLGVLRLGAAYLPLDITMPQPRIELCLADAAPAAVLTQRSLLQHLGRTAWNTVLSDDDRTHLFAETDSLPSFSPDEGCLDDTAYIIYTSGTTGVPKAVEISQRSLVNLLSSMQTEPGFGPNDVLLALTAVSFDISALELFLPLISGGKVVITTRAESQDPELLIAAITRSLCSVIQATPSTWRTLLRAGWKNTERMVNSGRPRLRLLCGGEALTGELADDLLATGAELWNMYGPTETTIWSMINPIVTQALRPAHSVSVGYPIANTQAYILDPQCQLVPVGVRGELFLGGVGLAKGYRGHTQLTAERFSTVRATGGTRLYRTGDLAYRRRDGTIYIVGRNDHQVKVRGHRLELEAVEAFVMQHPRISAAAARTWPEPNGEMRLIVYVVPNDADPITLADLRSFLASRVPEYMIPSSLVPLAALPVSSSGKTNRSLLPPPNLEGVALSNCMSSASPTESRLRAMWCELLGREQINLDDDFFSLGGHSLLVAALQQRLKSEFGHKVPMASLFHQPTIRQQAKLVDSIDEKHGLLAPGVLILQDQGEQQPLFWIHYANKSLATAIGYNQTFYSVVLTEEDLSTLGEAPTLEKIAAIHMQKILATQPVGPYRLGGFCVGGVVAYEIAYLLSEAGHAVSSVVLVDTPHPNPSSIKKFYRYTRWVLGTGGFRAITYSFQRRLDDRRRSREATGPVHEMRSAQEILEQAASKYSPHKYDGSVLLIQASDRLHMDLEPAWRDVIKSGLETQYVDGHHDDLMKSENVGDVGEVIQSHLIALGKKEVLV